MALDAFQQQKTFALTFMPMPYMREYLVELEGRGLHEGYVRAARNSLSYFADYLRGDCGLQHPGEIERVHILRFQGYCNDQVNAGTWQKSYTIQILKKVRSWIAWLEEIGYIDKSPWVSIKVPVVQKKPKPLSDEEIGLLFDAHRHGSFSMQPFGFHRREMILGLLYGWGLRVNELLALNCTNMDARREFVTVNNKGGGEKTLPYSPEIRKIYLRWSAARAKYAKPGEDALIISNLGKRMDYSDLYRIIVDLGTAAGISINPHRLRDTCATSLLDSDVDPTRVQKILGHRSLAMTMAYAKVNDHKVAEAHAAAMDPRLLRLFRPAAHG